MGCNRVEKIVDQGDLGADWIRVGNGITSELPSKLRFQDELRTEGKKKVAVLYPVQSYKPPIDEYSPL